MSLRSKRARLRRRRAARLRALMRGITADIRVILANAHQALK